MTRGLSDPLSGGVELAALRTGRDSGKPNLLRCGQCATGSPLRSSSSGWPVWITRTSPLVPVIVFRYGVQVGLRAVALARGRPRGWACRRARSPVARQLGVTNTTRWGDLVARR